MELMLTSAGVSPRAFKLTLARLLLGLELGAMTVPSNSEMDVRTLADRWLLSWAL
jgi:hypothetical protein